MKAAIYTRVSSDEQAEKGTSLATQREQARAYVQARGFDLIAEYEDAGISGAGDETTREALRLMMQAAREGEIEVIVVTKLDRFSRSMKQFVAAVAELDALGVQFVSVTEGFDSTTLTRQLLRNILASFADFERGRITERSTQGRRARAKEGVWVGGPTPFGHEAVEQQVLVNEEEAATVRRAVELLLVTGTTLAEVAHTLNAEDRLPRQWNPRSGIKREDWDHSRKRLWDSESLRRVLANESLSGTYTYGKTSTRENIVYEVPPILDERTYDLVQAHLKATSKNPSRQYKVYPLSGRLMSPCGLPCVGMFVTRKGRRYYRCRGKELRATERCSCPYYFEAEPLEAKVWWAVVPMLEDPKRLLELTGLDREDDVDAAQDEARRLDAQIALYEDALTTRVTSLVLANVSADRVAKATAKMEDELTQLKVKRERVVSTAVEGKERQHRRARLSNLARASLKLLNAEHDLVFQKTLLALLDVRAELSETGEISIRGVFREDLPLFDEKEHSPNDYSDKHSVRLYAFPFEVFACISAP